MKYYQSALILIAMFSVDAHATVTKGEQAAICAGAFGEAADYLGTVPSTPDILKTKQAFREKGLKFVTLTREEISANRITIEKAGELMDSIFLLSLTKQGYREGIIKECLIQSTILLDNPN